MAQKRARSALDEVDARGAFKRTEAGFHGVVQPGGRFEPEAGRYHLHIALACPWAAGTLSMLFLKGLDEAISYSVVHPTWARTRPEDPEDQHVGWHFRSPGDAAVPNGLGHGANECDEALRPDTATGCKTLREVYELARDETGKYSTPVLWCKKERTIVNNESSEILRMLNSSFNSIAKSPDVNLFPEGSEATLAELNSFIYPSVNNGVYRCGFARSQEAYEEALAELFAALGRLEEHLSGRRFLSGSDFTWLDLRLYHTLVRFDPVYHTYFKTNLCRIEDYPNLLNFVRDIYQMDAIRRSTNMKHIKMHYFTSHPALNTYGIIPGSNGPDLEAAHGREAL